MQKKIFKTLGALVLLAVLVLGALFAYRQFSPEAQTGEKTISVEIVHADGSEKKLSISTDAETLRAALEPEGILAGEDGPYGMFVKTVDGESVDDALQQWWCFTKGGESLMTGVDDTMIADGDAYEITFTTGW